MTSTTAYNGRLCNQIFRNIAVHLIAKKHNLHVDYSNKHIIDMLGIQLHCGEKIYNDTIQLSDSNYLDILSNSELSYNLNPNSSFFQTKSISNLIYNCIRMPEHQNNIIFNNPYKARYNNNNDVFIHVRLTDVEQYNPGIEYYLKVLKSITYDNIYIASDDFNHTIIEDILNAYPSASKIEYDEVKTIQFASTCKTIILSHGSFSAVIGYLSFDSNVHYSEYDETKLWYGDIFSIDGWIKHGPSSDLQIATS